jgi:hypothetical protein
MLITSFMVLVCQDMQHCFDEERMSSFQWPPGLEAIFHFDNHLSFLKQALLILSFHLANINVSPLQGICCQIVILHLMKTGSFECPSATDYSGNCILLDAWFTTLH